MLQFTPFKYNFSQTETQMLHDDKTLDFLATRPTGGAGEEVGVLRATASCRLEISEGM